MDMELRALLDHVDNTEVRDDYTGHPLRIEELTELSETFQIFIVQKGIQGNIGLYTVPFRERDPFSYLIEGEIIRSRPEAILLTAKEHGISAVEYGNF
jgi:hypothetical protein